MDQGIVYEFKNEYAWLSNFWPATFVWNNIEWANSEAAYQWAKTGNNDPKVMAEWADLCPAAAKQRGKTVDLRNDWDDVKYDIMKDIVRAKFTQNPHLREKLIATGHMHLEEGNVWHDKTWGICPPRSGLGKNWLGKVSMEIRTEFTGEPYPGVML